MALEEQQKLSPQNSQKGCVSGNPTIYHQSLQSAPNCEVFAFMKLESCRNCEVSSVLRSKDVTSSKQKLPFAVRDDEERQEGGGRGGGGEGEGEAGGNALAKRAPGLFFGNRAGEPVGPVPSENHPVPEPTSPTGATLPAETNTGRTRDKYPWQLKHVAKSRYAGQIHLDCAIRKSRNTPGFFAIIYEAKEKLEKNICSASLPRPRSCVSKARTQPSFLVKLGNANLATCPDDATLRNPTSRNKFLNTLSYSPHKMYIHVIRAMLDSHARELNSSFFPTQTLQRIQRSAERVEQRCGLHHLRSLEQTISSRKKDLILISKGIKIFEDIEKLYPDFCSLFAGKNFEKMRRTEAKYPCNCIDDARKLGVPSSRRVTMRVRSLSGTVNGKSLSQEAVFQTAAIFAPLFLGLTVIRRKILITKSKVGESRFFENESGCRISPAHQIATRKVMIPARDGHRVLSVLSCSFLLKIVTRKDMIPARDGHRALLAFLALSCSKGWTPWTEGFAGIIYFLFYLELNKLLKVRDICIDIIIKHAR
ncbi:hypothetical protein EAG_01339 [Camponotus floridanus]|uniref:Uncharacterized protein n=1 Tax=Camponotus floridanus TaxID=104421 RepID=E2AKL9_CAMFO|nr:hypothetical protein EAG_01339 [Camponotus floridanus]